MPPVFKVKMTETKGRGEFVLSPHLVDGASYRDFL